MLTTVLGQPCADAGDARLPQLNTTRLPRGGQYLAAGLGHHEVLTYTAACVVLLVFVVIVPAVWSTSETRRTAAQEVLDKLLRFLRPRH